MGDEGFYNHRMSRQFTFSPSANDRLQQPAPLRTPIKAARALTLMRTSVSAFLVCGLKHAQLSYPGEQRYLQSILALFIRIPRTGISLKMSLLGVLNGSKVSRLTQMDSDGVENRARPDHATSQKTIGKASLLPHV